MTEKTAKFVETKRRRVMLLCLKSKREWLSIQRMSMQVSAERKEDFLERRMKKLAV